MGTFTGHLVPGLAIALLGLWHTVNTIRAYYLKGSSNFVSKFWYPFKSPLPKLECLELILMLSFSIIAIVFQLLDFPLMQFSFRLDSFEHAAMFLHLAIFAGFTLFAELTDLSESLLGMSGVLAASVFGQELFLIHYHSVDHVGLEGHYHGLLQLIVFVSLISALASIGFPSSFPAALVLSSSVVFQGCWFMNMGFMLWVPEFVPRGCMMDQAGRGSSMHGAVICRSHEVDMRARALANLQFSWILSGILILMGCICFKFAKKFNTGGVRSDEYEKLHTRNVDVPIAVIGLK